MNIKREARMATLSFNTENQTFSNLMGRPVKYRVPPFQRDYSWEEDHWDDFWQDTLSLVDSTEDESHYMGYLVLQSSDNATYSIIDGQQRLTTVSILILSGLDFLNQLINEGIDPQKNKTRKEEITKRYIGFIDPITLETQSKLELNRHNNTFYQTYLVLLDKIPQRGLNSSEHKLRKAFMWFGEKIKNHIVISEGGGERLASFLLKLLDRLFFTVITVTDELNAFKVFETLNARGVRLSSTDLLKNLIFSTISNDDLHNYQFKQLEDRWERIVGALGGEALPEFLRVFWNSRNKLVRKADLFKVIKRSIVSKEQASILLRDLGYTADIYAALRDPTDSRWNINEANAIEQLNMFNVRQPIAMLMACYINYFESDRPSFTKTIKAISVISFRYNVICNLKTYEQEKLYSDIAVKIHNNIYNNTTELLNDLKTIYPDDNVFKAAFSEKSLKTTSARNKKVVRYILAEIERNVSGNAFDFNDPTYNLEHILPENPSIGWEEFDDQSFEKNVYRIGNMTLMKKNDNRDIGNLPYNKKIDSYKKSAFKITLSLNENYSNWTPSSISSRQASMAKKACSIWMIN